jgi:hypothetical protein
VPKWNEQEDVKPDIKPRIKREIKEERMDNPKTLVDGELVLDRDGGCPIMLQSPRIRKLLHEAFKRATIIGYTEHAFGELGIDRKHHYRAILIRSAKKLKYTDIEERLREDDSFANPMVPEASTAFLAQDASDMRRHLG